MTDRVVAVPAGDPVWSVYCWRQDSITLARLRPALEQLRHIPDQPCRLGDMPDTCMKLTDTRCLACVVRNVRADLFGQQPTGSE